jgi:hypothetical protein
MTEDHVVSHGHKQPASQDVCEQPESPKDQVAPEDIESGEQSVTNIERIYR